MTRCYNSCDRVDLGYTFQHGRRIAESFITGGEMLDIFVISTIVLAVWGAIGPLVGVRYGHELAKKSQREHWVNDNAKQEYRELVSVLFQSANIAIANRTLGRETTQAEDDKEFEADSAFLEAVNTRLFIRQFVEDAKIEERWQKSVQRVPIGQQRGSPEKSSKGDDSICRR